MIVKDYILQSPQGLHARPATVLVRLARGYRARVILRKGAQEVDLTSVLQVLSLAPQHGDTLTLSIEGPEEAQAAGALDNFFNTLHA